MYKILIFVAVVLVTNISVSQASLEDKLKAVFSQDKVTNILGNKAKKQYYQNVMFHSYEIQTIDADKLSVSSFPVLKTVTRVNSETKEFTENDNGADILASINNGNFNILLTNVKRDYSSNSYYKIKGTNKVLVVYSHQDIYKKK